MANLREKYGEWGVVLGATEGVGEAFCKKLAEGGMNLVMVGRREELLREKGDVATSPACTTSASSRTPRSRTTRRW